ncbi:hypothetical protein FQA39_LY01417 [Lamprigera yunnana]|nr:hypothetical protein FQA39_LY01417 [Lamprigera yunnana]
MDIGEVAVESGPCLDTVRALHQTVVALRSALEQSRNEILELKKRSWPKKSLENALRNLAIENYVLKSAIVQNERKLKDEDSTKRVKIITPPPIQSQHIELTSSSPNLVNNDRLFEGVSPIKPKNNSKFVDISITIEKVHSKHISNSLENLKAETPSTLPRSASLSKTFTFSTRDMTDNTLSTRTVSTPLNVSSSPNISVIERSQNAVLNPLALENAQSEPMLPQSDFEQNEEVDDIELIFTTDETKDSDFKEELVPIELETPNRNLHLQSDFEQSLSDRELDDDVFSEVDRLKKENSQISNSKSDNSINREEKSLKSYYSLQDSSFENKSLEKDESFDRFDDGICIIETDISKCGIIDVDYVAGRRNTCPNPLPYRPIIHREAVGKGLNMKKGRPILSHSNNARRESGVQTDISAVPSSLWRSESSLAHKAKVGENFTTLPSKFPLPGSRLRLSEKTNVEARRVLLSDIGFTSMVPELSRSADHLCPTNLKAPPTSYGQFLRTPDLYSPSFMSQKFMWTTTTASPSEMSQLQSQFGSTYPLSSPPAPSRRFSAPVSPSRRVAIKPTISKVRFANGSLPELRSDWCTIDSGDSTDSLVEEAEHYLRRSIDCITENYGNRRDEFKSRKFRRASAPEPSGDNVPPQNWQPFLPRTPRDLHLDHWVKVIVPEGRVRGGRVRYVGNLINQLEQYVGVQLSTPDGHSDGTYKNRRYFNCEPSHGIFVPFKKVVMGWRP